ncbi:MAG TPA: DNA replication initiation control protein YabA [Halanaerobiaceae bacterium]|jgi:regulator of replication initiation timing|nr:initiation control protein YabA [Bacillota bacterium]HHU92173.1 DNA replication initiation control protein YabA [Halanaerobiaceae bacterium]HOA41588.1 initiation control protein YabA [Halanaerobiales bacterium]HPZ63729.1 initiation control protein YabA [Halanaerobiales bacterium]HQD04971.1 initiation control protein YabA [Halanaerobiales bacterium]
MDKEVLSALAYFQEHLEEMSIRFQKLKDITYQLYKENEELKNENEELKEIIFARKKEKKGEAATNLLHLYKEGYHVCHPSFAERRKGDCLFCQQLIDNQLTEE